MFFRHEKFNFLALSASALDNTCIRCMLYSQIAIPVILNFLQYIPHSLTVLKFSFIGYQLSFTRAGTFLPYTSPQLRLLDEFPVLMPCTSAHAAETVADKILLRIRDWVGQVGDEPLTVTATLAVSEIRPGEDFESALNRADHALYKGKQQGRNQIILAS